MPELKLAFEEINCLDVMTYINSGNVVFSGNTQDENELVKKIEAVIAKNFNMNIPVTVRSANELSEILKNAPVWWGTDDKETYHNAIFVISPTRTEEVFEKIGDARPEYEQVDCYGNVIFWSASLKNFQKTRWSKIAGSSVNHKVTIRNANTTKKLLELAQQ